MVRGLGAAAPAVPRGGRDGAPRVAGAGRPGDPRRGAQAGRRGRPRGARRRRGPGADRPGQRAGGGPAGPPPQPPLQRAEHAAHRPAGAALLGPAAGDYLDYWSRLPETGLTGHDVVVKTRHDFADRLRARVAEIAQPAPLKVSYEEDTGHVVWIGDVEVSQLEAQEALVLRVLDQTWQTPEAIADACSDTDLAPSPHSAPPLISTPRHTLPQALRHPPNPPAH